MKSLSCRILCACLLVSVAAQSARAQFEGYLNKGLFGVGRVPANSFDRLGTNVDTLGGIFSAMALDPSSVVRQGGTYSGTLYGLPDRGFGDGAQDFRARIQVFAFSLLFSCFKAQKRWETRISFATWEVVASSSK